MKQSKRNKANAAAKAKKFADGKVSDYAVKGGPYKYGASPEETRAALVRGGY